MLDNEGTTRARRLIDEAAEITILTGAGISTDSGIPDFRGPNGLWTRNPDAEKASNIRNYLSDPEVRKRNWRARARGELWPDAEPNPGHAALCELEHRGKLHTLITQNVDGLHQQAGTSPDKVIEIHGTTRMARCLECDWRADISVVLERVRAGEDDPHCELCGGLIKPATISFGQSLILADLKRAQQAASECDLFVAVGTSLSVFPINSTVDIARSHGARIIIINNESTLYDSVADVVIRDSISGVLPQIVGVADPNS